MMYPNVSVISATGQYLDDLTNSQDLILELLTVGMGQAEVLGSRQKSQDGIEAPELKDELDRLRVQKSELEEIIACRSSIRPQVDPAAIAEMLRTASDGWNADTLPTIIRQHIQKYTPTMTVHSPSLWAYI